MKKNKNITIETLAEMVQSGFEGVHEEMDKRFEEVHEHLRIIDGRLDAMEIELMDIKKHLERMTTREEYEALKERVEALEKKLVKYEKHMKLKLV